MMFEARAATVMDARALQECRVIRQFDGDSRGSDIKFGINALTEPDRLPWRRKIDIILNSNSLATIPK